MHQGFFSCLQLFKCIVLNSTSLAGYETWCPTGLQHLCCNSLINKPVTSYINNIPDVSPLRLSEVDVQEVVDYTSHLDSHRVGIEGVLAKFVKASPINMALLVTKPINKTFCQVSWKSAIVTPIPKLQTNTSLFNFCPISVLPVFSKILKIGFFLIR